MTGITYPSGLKVAYAYTDGNISSLTINSKPWLSNIQYQPDGSVSAWTWADGSQHQRGYNQDGQLISQTLATTPRTLNYDDAGNLTAIVEGQNTLNLGYDSINRLITANHPSYSQRWQYDTNGNRSQQQDNTATTDYRIDPTSNRLLSSSGANFQTYLRDANGAMTQDVNHSYRYDTQNRLIAIDNGNTAQYHYNGLGQRTYKKVLQGTPLLFTYDETGKLLGEYTTLGSNQQETVWLGNLPVATVKNNTPYAIHTDHLGTPRAITDANKREIWRWNSDPFGTTPANEDPDHDGKPFTYNLRFAGQYFDAETGLHYNYFRDYDPRTGRYVQSDPIGLTGGINTYGYVGGNPLGLVDPLGLSPELSGFDACKKYCADLGLTVKSYTPTGIGFGFCKCDDDCPLDKYENPGHHDPSGKGPNPYNKNKSKLPENAEDLWKNSRSGSDGNRWAKEGKGKNTEYHRFQNDGNGNWHWNGSSNSVKADGTSNPIRENNIPKDVKKW